MSIGISSHFGNFPPEDCEYGSIQRNRQGRIQRDTFSLAAMLQCTWECPVGTPFQAEAALQTNKVDDIAASQKLDT
jgi:hypothetical protein